MILDGVKISYGVIDTTIEDDRIVGSASSNTQNSVVNNTLLQDTKTKLAYLEKDYFLLDGSFVLGLSNTKYNVGWESESVADTQGNITERITYIFENKHDSYGIKILFPQDSVPIDFAVTYYNGTAIVGQTSVQGNSAYSYANYDVRLQWDKVQIAFTKVKPQQRARLNEIVFGVNDMYDEDILISVTASKAIDLSGDYSDSGEFSFEFFNDGRFFIKDLNELPLSMQEGLEVIVYTKAKGEDEYKPFGYYLSNNTVVSNDGKVVSISGFDDLFWLNDTIYGKGIVYPQGKSLGAWAEDVAKDGNIDLYIDDVFYSIISTGYITEVPHREALRLIAEAGNGVIIVDNKGDLHLVRHQTSEAVNVITKDDIVEGTNNTSNIEKTLGIEVIRHSFSPSKNETELGYLEEVGLTAEPQEIEIVYAQYPVVVDSVRVQVDTATSSAIITDTKIYSDRVVITLSGDEGDSTFVTVVGKPYNSATTSVKRGSESKNVKKIETNYLITGNIAESVADYQFERVVNKFEYSAEVVTDEKIELGSRAVLDDEKVFITRRAFSIEYGEQTQTIEAVDE